MNDFKHIESVSLNDFLNAKARVLTLKDGLDEKLKSVMNERVSEISEDVFGILDECRDLLKQIEAQIEVD